MPDGLFNSAARKPFDPEGSDYDYDTARRLGLKPQPVDDDTVPHWPSRDPASGMLLKGRSHPTFDKGVKVDEELGYKLKKRGGRYYTIMDGAE